MKTIRFKNDWRYSRKGDVIEEGDGVALLLIQRNIAEEVKEEVKPEEATETKAGEGAIPDVHTRRIPGPREGSNRRGGRG